MHEIFAAGCLSTYNQSTKSIDYLK